MSKSDVFEFYEILALILPGSVTLYGISKLFPQLMFFFSGPSFSTGDFGVFVLIAYATGHVVQVFGGLVEYIWRQIRGEPVTWIKPGKKPLIFNNQIHILEEKIAKQLDIPRQEFHIKNLNRKEWLNMIKQMQIAVEVAGHTGRLDKFQAIYMMCRGLIAALLLLSVLSFFKMSPELWYLPSALFALAALLLYRMARFERHAVRELFIQFLQLPDHPKEK